MSREATLCLGVWFTLGFLVVSLSSCGESEEQVATKEAKAIQTALEDYPDAKEFPSGDLDRKFTIQVQDFFSANSGPFYVVTRFGEWDPVDIERRDNGVFLFYWDNRTNKNYLLRLRCSPEQVSQLLTGDETEEEHIIVFTVKNVGQADIELSAYSDEPEYGSYSIELEIATTFFVEGELIALVLLNDEGPTP